MNFLPSFVGDDLLVVYLVYGLAFFVLGLSILLAPKPRLPGLAASLPLLAGFGLLHSLFEWAEMLALDGRAVSPILRLGLLIASLLFLLEFSTRLLSVLKPKHRLLRWLPLSLLALWALMTVATSPLAGPGMELANAEVWARYVLHFPGCLLAAWAFLAQSRALTSQEPASLRFKTRAIAFVFLLNALFAGLPVPPVAYPPAAWLNTGTFAALTGLPAPLFRALGAMGITYLLFSILRTFEAERVKHLATVQQAAVAAQQAARQAAEQRSQELEAQVAQSESRYRYVFEQVNDAVFIHDLQGKFIQVNRVACQRLGYTHDELLRMGVQDIDLPEMAAHFAEGVQALIQQGKIVAASCHVRKDGSPIPVEISARMIEYNGQRAVLSVARDISERKRAEAEIQAHNRDLDALYHQAEERARRIAVSNEIIRTVSSARTLEHVFQTFAEQTRKLVPYDRMSIALMHETNTQLTVHSISETGMMGPPPGMLVPVAGTATPLVKETRQPYICPDVSQESRFPFAKQMLEKLGIQSYVVLPLIAKDEFLGALNLGSRSTNAYQEADLHVLVPIAGQLAIVIENARLQEQIANMAIREERDRLGRELHDSLGQVLGYIGLKTDQINDWLRRGLVEDVGQGLTELNQVAQTAYADVRESILGLRAAVTADAGLENVLREYLNRYQREWHIAGELTVAEGALPPLLPSVEIQLLRIVQEALTNVRKHAQASHVWIRFEREPERLVVTIRDDGIGFDPTLLRREHFGLETMRERAESVRGRLQIDSAPGRGAVIHVTLPASSAGR